MDTAKTKTEAPKCIYDDDKCGKDKLCGDCGLDLYEREQYQEAVDNFNLDRKIRGATPT
jgi:hypothetical protein